MKKLFSTILIAFILVFSTQCVFAAPKKAKKTVTKIEIETRDGFLLVGDLYFAAKKKPAKPLVILLHSFGSRASDWGMLGTNLRLANFNVLSLDLRGHGRSVYTANLKYKSRVSFKNDDWARFPTDIIDSIEYIKKNYPFINTSEIYIAGADIGASAAVLAASRMSIKPKKIVLISPFVRFKGLDIALIVPKLDVTPIMIMASKADKYSAAQADIISRLVHSPMTLKMFDKGGSGLVLLKRNPTAYTDILNYFSGK